MSMVRQGLRTGSLKPARGSCEFTQLVNFPRDGGRISLLPERPVQNERHGGGDERKKQRIRRESNILKLRTEKAGKASNVHRRKN